MPVQVSISESVTRGRAPSDLQKVVKEGLVIRDYLNAEITIGELAEILGMELEAARAWLHSQGVATLRRFRDPKLEQIAKANFKKLKKEVLPE